MLGNIARFKFLVRPRIMIPARFIIFVLAKKRVFCATLFTVNGKICWAKRMKISLRIPVQLEQIGGPASPESVRKALLPEALQQQGGPPKILHQYHPIVPELLAQNQPRFDGRRRSRRLLQINRS